MQTNKTPPINKHNEHCLLAFFDFESWLKKFPYLTLNMPKNNLCMLLTHFNILVFMFIYDIDMFPDYCNYFSIKKKRASLKLV